MSPTDGAGGPTRREGRRAALFGPPPTESSEAPTEQGRRAFFTAPDPSTSRPAPVPARTDDGVHLTVTCRNCRAETRLPLAAALPRLALSVWQPFGAYNRRMRCPSCQRIRWCRVDWSEVIDLR